MWSFPCPWLSGNVVSSLGSGFDSRLYRGIFSLVENYSTVCVVFLLFLILSILAYVIYRRILHNRALTFKSLVTLEVKQNSYIKYDISTQIIPLKLRLDMDRWQVHCKPVGKKGNDQKRKKLRSESYT